MKTLFKILFLGVLSVLLTMAAMAEAPAMHGKWKPVNGKDKDLFVLKADKNLVGARVEIIQSNGAVIAEQILKKRKLVIDFNDIRSGEYVIRIAKGERVEEFTYTKH